MRKVSFVLAVLLLASLQTAAQYNVKLIDCPDAVDTRFVDINNDGLIVGTFVGADGLTHAMVYRNGACESLQPLFPPEIAQSIANGINLQGDIVGTAPGSFLIRSGTVTYLNMPTRVIDSSPQAINDKGEIVGYFFTEENGPYHGFKMDNNGNFTELFLDFEGVVNVLPWRINARGDIAGNWDSGESLGHAFVIPKNITPYSFDVPTAEPMGTFGSGINNRGDLVGKFRPLDGTCGKGFALIGGQLVVLDCPTGAINIQPSAINNKRVIVGFVRDANSPDGKRVFHAFIATPVKVFE